MKPALIVIGILLCLAFTASAILFAKEKTAPSLVQLLGAVFLVVVVLVHVAEGLHLFPRMRWDFPTAWDIMSISSAPLLA